jgi:VCBS repeat-containing protein
VLEDSSVNGSVAGNDSDPDADALTYSLVGPAPTGLTFNANGSYTFDASDYDYLAEGATEDVVVTYKVSDGHGGSDTATLTITVTGVDDAAVVSGNLTGTATEAGVTPGEGGVVVPGTVASGNVDFTDVDDGFADDVWAVDSGAGDSGYGTFTVAADGSWTYTADDSNTDVNGLQAGEELVDTFTIVTNGGVEEVITVTIKGANDAPVTAEDATAADENEVVTFNVIANDSDPDDDTADLVIGRANTRGGPTATDGSPAANGLTVDGQNIVFDQNAYVHDVDGNSVTGFDYLAEGETAVVLIDYNAVDPAGANSHITAPPYSTLTITITGVNDAATFGGDDSGDVTEDGDLTASGLLTVDDVDGADTFQADTFAGTYGSLALAADGSWTYTLDNDDDDLDALDSGQQDDEVFTILSADGTEHQITVTVHGADEASPYTPPPVFTGGGDPNDFDNLGNPAGQNISSTATNGDDTLYGGAGNDTINGGGGNDTIYAGSGNDDVDGNNDNDTLYGGSGTDTIKGANNNDVLIGGYGADTLTGSNGSDTFKEAVGVDVDRDADLGAPVELAEPVADDVLDVELARGVDQQALAVAAAQHGERGGGGAEHRHALDLGAAWPMRRATASASALSSAETMIAASRPNGGIAASRRASVSAA